MRRLESRKLDKTLADYIGIAISPVLIMVMIGSLMFFLLEVVYEGDYAGRLRWTIFWFVLASVLISRISIEQGSTHAGIYGFALAVATGLMLSRFISTVLGVWLFLAFIWWCASKLTWDCTLIDDDEDASGEGLLQVARLGENSTTSEKSESTEARTNEPIPFWRQLFGNRSERAGQPHAPGLWAVYFSLIALPLFGVGQLLIPRSETGDQRSGFGLLWVYTAAALGLLLTTSFLGLRRYLRQRRLQMAPDVARTWIGFGTTVAAAILLCCVLLPRPEAQYSLTALINKVSSPSGAVSEYSLFRRFAEGGDDQGGKDPQNEDQLRGRGRRGAGAGEDNAGGVKQDRDGMDSSTVPRSGVSPFGYWFATLLRWLLYAVFICLAIYWIVRKRPQIVEALKQLIRDFIAFWRGLFGWKRPASPTEAGLETARAPVREPSFGSFTNPFASGKARQMSLAELICYSFEALQACARDCGVPRRPEQTPLEFGSVLGRAIPDLHTDAPHITRLYTRLAYSGRTPAENSLDGLERLWRQMAAIGGSVRR